MLLDKALENQNTETHEHHSSQSFNLLFELCKVDVVREHLLSFLGPQDLQKLGATGLKYPGYQMSCMGLFFDCKAHYLKRTRLAQAKTLRDLVLKWDYKRIEALVTRDPKVLSIVCDYKMNRWQEDSAKRRLSALEYAWLAGDENFIELFERLGADHLNKSCYQNKEALQAESIAMLRNLAQALSDYADGGAWDACGAVWCAAPHWVYAMACYFDAEWINAIGIVSCADVFSDAFRFRAHDAGPGGLQLDLGTRLVLVGVLSHGLLCVSQYICQNHTLANSSGDRVQSNGTTPVELNMLSKRPGQ